MLESQPCNTRIAFLAARKVRRGERPGLIGSLLLHGLAALLVFVFVAKTARRRRSNASLRAGGPGAPRHGNPIAAGTEQGSGAATEGGCAAGSRQSHARNRFAQRNQAARRSMRWTPSCAALAKLRQPPSNLKIADGQGVSNVDAANGAPGDRALYSVKDYVRAQVERRWSLNLAKLAGRNFTIPIRVVMKRDGTIVSAEIVEEARTKTDAPYRDIALSARNAVILSSPIALPPGDLPADHALHAGPRSERDTQQLITADRAPRGIRRGWNNRYSPPSGSPPLRVAERMKTGTLSHEPPRSTCLVQSGFDPGAAVGRRADIGAVPAIRRPLPDIAQHAVKPERIGREAVDVRQFAVVPLAAAAVAVGIVGADVVAPPARRGGAARARHIPIPLRSAGDRDRLRQARTVEAHLLRSARRCRPPHPSNRGRRRPAARLLVVGRIGEARCPSERHFMFSSALQGRG